MGGGRARGNARVRRQGHGRVLPERFPHPHGRSDRRDRRRHGKARVASIQAALWVGLRRLGKGLGPNLGYGGALPDVLGRLFRTDVAAR
jgi:hypothetical protein